MSERFYYPDSLELGPLSITGAEAHHIAQVLRMKPGSEVTLFNGDGREYPARIDAVSKFQIEIEVLEVRSIQRESTCEVTIACPLPKGDRAAFLIEKLTELGVAHYLPLQTQRSVVHPGEGKIEKLNRYVIEASKQCGRNVLMTIEPMMKWNDLVQDSALSAQRYLADASGTMKLGSSSSVSAQNKPASIIALGPEGGWSAEELKLAQDHHWRIIALGKSILRIETAALAAAVLAVQ